MRILVCGGRDYNDMATMTKVLNIFDPIGIVTGGAKGADTLAENWADKRDVPVSKYMADWGEYGKAAGFIRNKEMLLKEKPDLVIAFPGGKGTKHMIKTAKEHGYFVLNIGETSNG